MRIIGIVNQTSGSCYHRVYTPLMNMGHEVLITNTLFDEAFNKPVDVVVINRYCSFISVDANENEDDFLIKEWEKNDKKIDEYRKKYGFKLVIDIDDFWQLDNSHIFYNNWTDNKIANFILNNIIKADIVTTTHSRLAELIEPYNKNVYILPNAIPNGFEQFNINKIESEQIRLMWQGSITHKNDVNILRNPMKRVLTDSILMNKVQTVFAGFIEDLMDCNYMLDAFTCGLQLSPKVYKAMKPTEYYQIYNDADICLIPLVDSKFNSYKSNLKILEAASAGIPVIVSNVNPYLNFEHVLYVDSQKDWYKNIKLLVDNENERKEYGLKLKEYCNEKYNFNKINQIRKEIYESRK
ncbi:RfaG Glycosyltransferase [uncultured Caudovirales phage]|uniref:RfaG Glycosyltransferase n=1 Tax=uncultured Caudovirales phage TaxID=2100421 RepID=A0A6J7WJ00_9CAUD|nr:RfaG Glycosyltransferase [uncultured Caudovirales phage]